MLNEPELILPCFLVGGPFDGDFSLILYLVPCVWVVACGNPECPMDGTHWLLDPVQWLPCERYDLVSEEPDEAGSYTYVYAAMNDSADVVALTNEVSE